MSEKPESPTQGEKKLNCYATFGLFGGLFFGLVVGVIVSGSHFSGWPAYQLLLAIIGSGLGGAVLGYILPGLAVGFTTGGSTDPTTGFSTAHGGDLGAHDSGHFGGDGDGGSSAH